jgi:CHAD domain-containing protein
MMPPFRDLQAPGKRASSKNTTGRTDCLDTAQGRGMLCYSEFLMTKSDPQEMSPTVPVPQNGTVVLKHGWLPPGENAEAWGRARKLALRQAGRILKVIPKIFRSGKPERIHELRVATRRLQAVLDLLTLPTSPRLVKRLRRKIKASRRAFSDVRNCDVLIESIEKRLQSRRAAHREAWQAVLESVQQQRADACTRAVRKLSKLNFERVYVRLQSVLLVPPSSDTVGSDSAGSQPAPGSSANTVLLRHRVLKELERVWRRFQAEFTASQESPTVQSIHQARIAAKRVRYLVEVMDEFEVPGARQAAAWLRDLQQYLGAWHDLDVAEEMMAEVLGKPQFVRDHLDLASGILKLIAQERKAKLRFSAKYHDLGLVSGDGARFRVWVETLLNQGQTEDSKQ